VLFNNLKPTGPGQGCRVSGLVPKPTRSFKPKIKKVYKPKASLGSALGPKKAKARLAIKRLTVGEPFVAEAGSSARLGLLMMEGCLDCSKASVSSSQQDFDNQKSAHEEFFDSWTEALGLSRSVLMGVRVENGVNPDGLGLSVEDGSLRRSKAIKVASVLVREEV
jgi:hypothetical protein